MKKIAILPFVFLAACATTSRPTAVATLAPTANNTASGTVRFVQLADGSVDVTAEMTNVPAGVHGFHVHERGDCGDNGNAAGGHFNPTGTPHGGPEAAQKHAGDFGNVTADANGRATARFNTRSVTVEAGASSAVGRAVILHANPDDLTTQPTGNAGGRIACGVVTLQQP